MMDRGHGEEKDETHQEHLGLVACIDGPGESPQEDGHQTDERTPGGDRPGGEGCDGRGER